MRKSLPFDHIADAEWTRNTLSLEAIFPTLSPKLQAKVREGMTALADETGDPGIAKKVERIQALSN